MTWYLQEDPYIYYDFNIRTEDGHEYPESFPEIENDSIDRVDGPKVTKESMKIRKHFPESWIYDSFDWYEDF